MARKPSTPLRAYRIDAVTAEGKSLRPRYFFSRHKAEEFKDKANQVGQHLGWRIKGIEEVSPVEAAGHG